MVLTPPGAVIDWVLLPDPAGAEAHHYFWRFLPFRFLCAAAVFAI